MIEDKVETDVRNWVESFVVGLNLCPFAKKELLADRVRLAVSSVDSELELLAVLQFELELLERDDNIETTLLIHPCVLTEFEDYNQFLALCDGLLGQLGLEGVYQIASFHPGYRFEGTEMDAVENNTNRSPYPLLHLLREDSLESAIANFPDVDQIPLRNIELMRKLGRESQEKGKLK